MAVRMGKKGGGGGVEGDGWFPSVRRRWPRVKVQLTPPRRDCPKRKGPDQRALLIRQCTTCYRSRARHTDPVVPVSGNLDQWQSRHAAAQLQGRTDLSRFPENFLWGAATAAYQIEGSPLADGAGASIWQRFSHDPRLMAAKGDTGDIACDHYNRMESDVDMMKALGLQAYRFCVNWGRVLPEGTGRVNEAGLDFYERLVDRLIANGMEPLLTLHHWDLPAALDDRGGWLNRDSADWFAEYARVMFERLDGRVKKWVTFNEPWVMTDGGYLHGALAPGHRNMFEAAIASHNIMRAHGAGVRAYREIGKHEIGLVVNIEPKYPASDSAEDKAATARADAYMNRQYLDPALKGSYPH